MVTCTKLYIYMIRLPTESEQEKTEPKYMPRCFTAGSYRYSVANSNYHQVFYFPLLISLLFKEWMDLLGKGIFIIQCCSRFRKCSCENIIMASYPILALKLHHSQDLLPTWKVCCISKWGLRLNNLYKCLNGSLQQHKPIHSSVQHSLPFSLYCSAHWLQSLTQNEPNYCYFTVHYVILEPHISYINSDMIGNNKVVICWE